MHYSELDMVAFRSAPATSTRTRPWDILAAFPLAVLIALTSLGGILIPSLYVHESTNWAAQALGQDWVDLLLAVPWLLLTGALAARGSKRALSLLAGALLYTVYTFVIYAFGMHFNLLFLVYCAALGVSFFALGGTLLRLFDEPVDEASPTATRVAGYFLIAIGALFGWVWLTDIVPALFWNSTPGSIAEAGTPTNPVYVMDLAVILPLHIATGVALLRGRPFGQVLAPIVLSFGVLMSLSIAGMLIVMRLRGVGADIGVAIGMTMVSVMTAAVLERLLLSTGTRSA